MTNCLQISGDVNIAVWILAIHCTKTCKNHQDVMLQILLVSFYIIYLFYISFLCYISSGVVPLHVQLEFTDWHAHELDMIDHCTRPLIVNALWLLTNTCVTVLLLHSAEPRYRLIGPKHLTSNFDLDKHLTTWLFEHVEVRCTFKNTQKGRMDS